MKYYIQYIWGGVWNKALSDYWCNVKLSSSFTTEFKEIGKDNLVIYQNSLKTFLQAPLQLLQILSCSHTSVVLVCSRMVLPHCIWQLKKAMWML